MLNEKKKSFQIRFKFLFNNQQTNDPIMCFAIEDLDSNFFFFRTRLQMFPQFECCNYGIFAGKTVFFFISEDSITKRGKKKKVFSKRKKKNEAIAL